MGNKSKIHWILWFLIATAVIVVLLAVYKGCFQNVGNQNLAFKTENILLDDVLTSISSSGTVEPEELINVGAQVSGKIMSFGKDADGHQVDYGSRVTAGMVLAQIDDVLYAAELQESKAQKQQAQAAITSAKASIKQAQAQEILAELNWKRAQELYAKRAMAKSDYDTAEASYASAQADTLAAQAALSQGEAQLAIAEAALVKAQRNMDYCVITAPVDGIIIDRRVSIGQTVVSNMSASSIFLIAKDFQKMQVWVSVNEADVGSISKDMPVEFTVDAYPEHLFVGKVQKIRLNATMSQNVITYIVEVATDNPDRKLIPYLTANVRFIKEKHSQVLTVSNAAIRFNPPASCIDAEYAESPVLQGAHIWVEGENGLIPLAVKTGLMSNGRVEISGEDLSQGMPVVFGIAAVSDPRTKKSDEIRSPFMPEMPKRVRGNGSAANRQREQQNQK